MQDPVRQIHTLLLKNNLTVATAESCTAGLLSCLLTRLPGSSSFFTFGAITYSNQAKNRILAIPHSLIRQYGAVSRRVAILMAGNVRRLARTDIGVGITGIAGPSGGTAHKPVGTVYIAVAHRSGTVCQKHLFKGNRTGIRRQAACAALKMLVTVLSR